MYLALFLEFPYFLDIFYRKGEVLAHFMGQKTA